MAKILEDLPTPNQSRQESYLGVMAGQEGAIMPEKPLSREEEYLEYIAEHGGGGGGEPAAYLKSISKNETNKEVVITDKEGTETKFPYDAKHIALTSETGVLTQEQLDLLAASKNNLVLYNDSIFRNAGKTVSEGLKGKWLFKESMGAVIGIPPTCYATFISDLTEYSAFGFLMADPPDGMDLYYFSDDVGMFKVYDYSTGWNDQKYRTIDIITEPTEELCIQYIMENATKLPLTKYSSDKYDLLYDPDTGEYTITAKGSGVTSVNEKTGDVVLSASDIKATNTQTIQENLERIDENVGDRYTKDETDNLLEDKVNTDIVDSSASSTDKLIPESKINEKIEMVEANQLYKDANQGSFATKAELTSATKFYGADGNETTPTKNDVVYVLADESHDGKSAKYTVASVDPVVWAFVIVYEVTFTQAQMNAINSGISAEKIAEMDTNIGNKVDKVAGKDLSTNDYDDNEKGKVAGAVQKTDVVDDLVSTDTDKPLSANQGKELEDKKQNSTDNTLQTQSKDIPTAINEVKATKTEIKEISANITEALNKNYLYNILKDGINLIFTDAETSKQYKQVEYIETDSETTTSSGQYIKTGVYFTETDNRTGTEIRCKIKPTQLPGSGANKSIMGFLTNTSTTTHAMSLWVGNGGGSSYFGKIVNLHNSKLVEQSITWNADGVVAIYGDGTSETQVASTGTLRNGPFTKPLHIMWTGSTGQSRFAGRFFYLQFYKYGILQQNYIPVIDIDTNEYGLFETISNKFYGNDGTGAFTGGNVVSANKGLYMVENNALVKLVKESEISIGISNIPGFDSSKVQKLTNTNGAITWVDEV